MKREGALREIKRRAESVGGGEEAVARVAANVVEVLVRDLGAGAALAYPRSLPLLLFDRSSFDGRLNSLSVRLTRLGELIRDD